MNSAPPPPQKTPYGPRPGDVFCKVVFVVVLSEFLSFAAYILGGISSINSLVLLEMKEALRETQTLRAGCSKGGVKKFRSAADPFPGARDGQILISWRWSLPSPTDPVW